MTIARDVVEAHYAAADAGDLAGMLAPLALGIIWTESAGSPLAGTWVGSDAVAEKVFAARLRDWHGFSVAIDELFESGDTIIALGAYTGTYRATGRSFQARVAQIWRVTDGRAVRHEQISDTAGMLAAMSSQGVS